MRSVGRGASLFSRRRRQDENQSLLRATDGIVQERPTIDRRVKEKLLNLFRDAQPALVALQREHDTWKNIKRNQVALRSKNARRVINAADKVEKILGLIEFFDPSGVTAEIKEGLSAVKALSEFALNVKSMMNESTHHEATPLLAEPPAGLNELYGRLEELNEEYESVSSNLQIIYEDIQNMLG